MTGRVAVGTAQGLDARQIARRAVQKALDTLGTTRPALCIAFVSAEFSSAEALRGIQSLLGTLPVWGFSTTAPLTAGGAHSYSVSVMIVSGLSLKAQSFWLPEFARDPSVAAHSLMTSLTEIGAQPHGLLLALDGVSGGAGSLCTELSGLHLPILGALATGDRQQGRADVLSTNGCQHGALSAVTLEGKFACGAGRGHGWLDLGITCRVSRANGLWVNQLDGANAAEVYARIFGYPVHDWSFPPLKELVRLYPLGLETSGGELLLRSPLHVEVDGSLRMNAPVPEGSRAHFMAGDPETCRRVVTQAVAQARAALGNARPLAAIALADVAWQMLFEASPNQLAESLAAELGAVPFVGAYTLGQIFPSPGAGPTQVYNQDLQVILLGESD